MKKQLILFVALLLSAFVTAQNTVTYTVILRSNVGTDTMWDGVTMRVYGLTPSLSSPVIVPAKTLYCNEGDSLVLHAYNISQNEHHTVHMHGLDADTRNDGDPMTSFWLNHMEDTTYSVRAMHAGTYFYHCHVADIVHQQLGMYGFIVVRAAGGVNNAYTGGPAFSKAYNWMLAEYDRSWHDTIPVHDTMTNTVMVPKYVPDYFLVNGHSQQELLPDDSTHIHASVNEPIYLRLGNMGYCDDKIIFPSSLQAHIIDSDGRPLPNPVYTDTVLVAPGETYGVMLLPTVQFSGTIEVQYANMNTGISYHSEFPPIDVTGYFGISEQSANEGCAVFPNPAGDHFTVMLENPVTESYTVELFAADGKRVYSERISNGQNYFTITPHVADDLYVLRITGDESGKMWMRKVQLTQ